MITPDNFYCLLIRGTNLSAAEREHVTHVYESAGKEKLYEQMQKKKILPFAANAFVACGLDKDFWEPILLQYRQRNQRILCALDEVYSELGRQGVTRMFVSENFAALLASGNDLALFASGDIDNHADPCEKEKIYRAFEVLGYKRKERFAGNHQIAAEFFPPETEGLPEKFYISVDFYPLARLKLPCFIASEKFVNWDSLYCYENASVRLPSANALAYICMMHLSLHSFSRAPDIRLYIDLLNVFQTDVDYERLAVWCKEDKTCTRAAVAAQLSNLLMHTAFPDFLIQLSSKRHRLIKQVYDKERNDLRYEPRGLKVLLIEVYCNDQSMVHGLKEILFPDKNWMKLVYGSSGLAAHIKHFGKVI